MPGGGVVPILICVVGCAIIHNRARFIANREFLLHFAPSLEIRGQLQMDPTEIAGLIEAGLPQAEVKVLSDDNTHFDALVVSEMFEDKRPIARHQMIYKCLGTLMGNEIHAMSIRAYTPDEWRDLAT